MLKVGIVDKRDVATYGIFKILEDHPSIRPISICEKTNDEIFESVLKHQPDIIVIDIGYNGTEIIDRIHRKLSDLRFITVTDEVNNDECCFVCSIGTGAYLSKEDVKVNNLVEIILLVAEGKFILCRDMAEHLLCKHKSSMETLPEKQEKLGTLTRRENTVLELVARGLSNNEIATTLAISVYTVRVHLRNIMAKLGAHNRLHAVYLAGMNECMPVSQSMAIAQH
ncbi:MAG: response regulator transcription factor [Dehalococcoidales bacterium]|nr:response regulator transcription factor [Dehalococcoidales bacterium]